jgi:hypothetical protein
LGVNRGRALIHRRISGMGIRGNPAGRDRFTGPAQHSRGHSDMFDIRQVFSNAWTALKDRWLLMIGMWAIFFGLMMIYYFVFGGVLGGAMLATGAMAGGAMGGSDPTALLGSLGVGFILMTMLFLFGYMVIALGQQAGMIAIATPVERVNFGDAMMRGLKGGLTLLGVIVLMVLLGVVFALIAALIIVILQFMGDMGAVIGILLLAPIAIYLALRFAVLVPVIVVEKVFNPITAMGRAWQVTSGKVLGILIVYVVVTVLAVVIFFVPFVLLVGSPLALASGGADPMGAAAAGIGAIFGAIVLIFFLSIAYALFTTALSAALHAQISDAHTVDLGKTFE